MILVTGGAGYVGTILISHLLAKNYRVKILDSFIFDNLSQFKKNFPNVEIIQKDIRNADSKVFRGVRSVVHLAGLSNDPTADFDPQANYEINTVATANLAKLAKESGVKRFIFGSSCSIYDQGMTKKQKMKNEKSEVNPRAGYSISKLTAEKIILDMANNNFTVVVLRKGTVFGYSPRMRFDLVVNTMIKDAIHTGRISVKAKGLQWRPLISVTDAAKGYLKVLETDDKKVNKQIINLLSNNYQIIDVAKKVQKVISKQRRVELLVDDVICETRSYKVSNSKMNKLLKFRINDNLESEIKKIVKKIKKNKIENFEDPRYYNINWMKIQYKNRNYQ